MIVKEWNKTKDLWDFVIVNYGDVFNFKDLTAVRLSQDFEIKYGNRFVYEGFLNYELTTISNHFVTLNFDSWVHLFEIDLTKEDISKNERNCSYSNNEEFEIKNFQNNEKNKKLNKDLLDFSNNEAMKEQISNIGKNTNSNELKKLEESFSKDIVNYNKNLDKIKNLNLITKLNNDLEQFLLTSSY